MIIANIVSNNNTAYMDAGSGIFLDTPGNMLCFNYIFDDQSDKTQFIPIHAYTNHNLILSTWAGPQAYFRNKIAFVGSEENDIIHLSPHHPWQVSDVLEYIVGFQE